MEIPTSRTAAPFKSSDFDEIDWAVVAHLLHGVENLQGLQRLAPSHYSMPSENRESQEVCIFCCACLRDLDQSHIQAMLQVASAEEGLVIAVSSALTWHSIRKCLNNVFSSAVLLVQTILVLSDHGPHEGETPQVCAFLCLVSMASDLIFFES